MKGRGGCQKKGERDEKDEYGNGKKGEVETVNTNTHTHTRVCVYMYINMYVDV
jgi:hypothetical protein